MSQKRKSLVARSLVDMSPFLAGYSDLIALGVDGDGAIYAVAGNTGEPLAEDRGIGIFPKSRLEGSTRYLVCRWQAGEQRSITIQAEDTVVSYVQPTSKGILLVGARCRWHATGPEKNAVEYSWAGDEVQRFTLGDGIEGLRTTPNGSIWASYFDEGVFGNYGWNGPGPECIGASGCVRFDSEGKKQFAFSAEDAGTDDICDAYAMNVVGDDDVWLYFYTEFPIVHIARGAYTVWEIGIGGAHGLAVDGKRVLLFGDYEQRNMARIVNLGSNGKATVTSELLLIDEHGAAIDNARPCGVGNKLYLFRNREVLVVDSW